MFKRIITVIIASVMAFPFTVEARQEAFLSSELPQFGGGGKKNKVKKRYMTHVVGRSETLYTILDKYRIPLAVLKTDNPQLISREVTQGEILKIDTDAMGTVTSEQINDEFNAEIERLKALSSGVPVAGGASKVNSAGFGTGSATPTTSATVSSNRAAQGGAVGATGAVVLNGDAIKSNPKLATSNTSSVHGNGENIGEEAGANVVAEQNEGSVKEPYIKDGYIHHPVASGETLFGIAQKYGVIVPELRQLNSHLIASGIIPGMILRVPLNDNNRSMVAEKASEGAGAGVYSGITFGATPAQANPEKYKSIEIASRPAKNFDASSTPINVSLILPFTVSDSTVNSQFVEFYQGFLLGMDSLKREGTSINLRVLDSKKSLDKINDIIASGELASSDIIVGPVYDDMFCEVAAYASSQKIPIISPLAKISCPNSVTFQASPDEKYRYSKMSGFLKDKKVVLINTGSDDAAYIDEIKPLLPADYTVMQFYDKARPETYMGYLNNINETVFVFGADTERVTDAVLSQLSALRSLSGSRRFSVLASPKISRMNNLDPAYFFRLDLHYITSYHVDRLNKDVLSFDAGYIATYNRVPSLYAYRGYDVAMFFVGSMKEFGNDFWDDINDYFTTILQMKYHIIKEGSGYINTEWSLVNYKPDYTVSLD